MTITELIAALEAVHTEHGDVPVLLMNTQGDVESVAWSVEVRPSHFIRQRGRPLAEPSPTAVVLDKQR